MRSTVMWPSTAISIPRAACFADVYDRMIVYTAISKTFNMAGLHSSCSIIPNPEYKKRQEASLREAWLMSPELPV